MDSIDVEKIQALRKYKEQQFVSNLLFYALAALTFGLFCTSPFWFPSLYSSTKTLVCVSIPRIIFVFLSAKSLFILGNLIVIFLLRDSKVRRSDASDNGNNGDSLVKQILPKTRSEKAKIRTVSPKKSGVVQASKPLYQHNNHVMDPVKLTPPSIETEKAKMHTVFSKAGKTVISNGLSERIHVGPYSISKVNSVRYVEEKERHKSLSHVEDQAGELVAENESLCEVVRKERVELKRGREAVMAPALSTDELKRKADDFIAMVNEQIRLEAADVLLDAC